MAPPERRRRWRPLVAASALYLLAAVGLWWGVWSSHPAGVTTCGCGDAARFLWFFEWPAYALTHGHSLWHSAWLFHPKGLNLLDDTSVLALGVTLVPVTLAWGPVAAMNVALTLAPCLSALAMFVLLRRWVSWTPAAFVGGLLYGFSPFVVTELALNQLNLAFLALVPLIVLALDELVVRRRRSPFVVGALLAAAVVVEFFVSVELLLIVALAAGFGLLVLWAHGAATSGRLRVPGSRHALRGLATAAGLSAVALAYPLWYFAAGPAHLGGPIWSEGTLSGFGNSLADLVRPGGLASLEATMHRLGGYQGSDLPGLGYVGLGALAVALVGTLVWRRDRRLWLFWAVALFGAALSLGPAAVTWAPWRLLRGIPRLGDVVEVRFSSVTVFALSVLVALVVDHLARRSRVPERRRWRGPAAAAVAVLVALGPTAAAVGAAVPLTTEPVVLPAWFRGPGTVAVPGRVVLAYPVPFSGIQSSQAWQAVGGMSFAMAGGGGPAGELSRAGRQRPGAAVLFAASLPLGPAPEPGAAHVAAVRQALAAWQVTTVVVPDQAALEPYDRGRATAYAVGFFTAALGTAPAHVDGAWVWGGVRRAPPPAPLEGDAFTGCVARGAPSAVAACVLATAR